MAIENSFVFGGVSTTTYGVLVEGSGDYSGAKRVVEMISIPGRNGELALDKGHFENEPVEYEVLIQGATQATFEQAVSAFKNAIMSKTGYQRLTDTYHSGEYRMAVYVGGFDEEPTFHGKGASFKLEFSCKPQRFLTSGETAVAVSSGDTITNPTLFEASPLLLVDGYGEIEFGNYSVTIENEVMGQVSVYGGRSKSQTSRNTATASIDDSMLNNGDSIYFGGVTWYLSCNRKSIYSSYACSISSSSNAIGATNANGTDRSVTLNGFTFTYGTAGSTTGSVTFQHNYTQSGTARTETATFSISATYDGGTDIAIELTVPTMVAYGIGAKSVEIPAFDAYSTVSILGTPIYIDCDLGEAYKYEGDTLVSLNSNIDLGSDLPTLAVGNNTFTFDNTVTDLKVVPRWWKI